MAHGISEVMVNGKMVAEAAFAEQPAWHGLGTVVTSAMTSEEAMTKAHLDWKVEKQPLYLGDGSLAKGMNALVRVDSGKVLGYAGDIYKPWQNHQGFAFLDSLVQDGVIRYESAMALWGGEKVVLLARMPESDEVVKGDISHRYILCSMGHNGQDQIILQPTSVRVVCANTLRVAITDRQYQIRIKHTDRMEGRLQFAKKYLSQFNEGFTLFRDHARQLASKTITSGKAKDFISMLFPAPGKDATDRIKGNYEKKLGKLRECYKLENDLTPAKHSWWVMVNSVTRFIDHLTKSRGEDDRTRAENKMVNVLEGDGASLKNAAFDLALTMSV